jgi:lysophospholipase
MRSEAEPVSRRETPATLVTSSWRADDGWPHRAFSQVAAGTPKGSLLFLGGRGDFFEKYLEGFHAWRIAGWNVEGFDWRGQGGSGQLHPGGFCHIDNFAAFVDDLAAYCTQWRERVPGPHVAIGHSMGGHILLRVLTERRVEVDGAVLLAPMLGIKAGRLPAGALWGLACLGRIPGMRGRPIWTGRDSPAPGRVTSCPERQADKLWWKDTRPEIGRGGPTWGWLAAAIRSIAELDKSLRRTPPETPGLVLTAGGDPIVDAGAILRALPFLPRFEHAVIHGAAHEMLRERDEIRIECLERIERFLGRVEKAHLSTKNTAAANSL